MYRLTILLSFCLLTGLCKSQPVDILFPDTYISIGAFSAHFTDAFSFTVNSAALAHADSPGGGVFSQRPYLLKELALHAAVYATPLRKGGLGMMLHYSGHPYLQYIQTGLAYGLRLSANMDLGLQFNYSHTRIPGYRSAHAFGASVGVLLRLSEQLYTGIQVSDLGAALMTSRRSLRPAARYIFGIGYEISRQVLVKCDLVKTGHQPATLMPGLQYNISDQALVRAGITQNSAFLLGAGLRWKHIRADVFSSYDARLGFTPSLLIIMNPPSFRKL